MGGLLHEFAALHNGACRSAEARHNRKRPVNKATRFAGKNPASSMLNRTLTTFGWLSGG